ncbi:uncharacterized protein LOC100085358 [Ornithorhynchus anatinus]|uniref:uncharacterized protein LOC100085358 n=1 Tax=Ornithorhynchus anatinus TaxID=9258 RepID=UPI0010A85903|nr:uncharacterized protein LOC100085358 [Ornithorhynchus anatinus]
MISHNMTWIRYPTHLGADFESIIASQSIISRFMQAYFALFVPTSLAAGAFILTTFIRKRTTLEKLDIFLWDLAVTNILVTLFSFTAFVRPKYISTSNLICGVLSFFFNVCYFNAQYLQMVMLFTFLLHNYPNWMNVVTSIPQKPLGCLGLILACAFCSSLVGVSLLGTAGTLHEITSCQVDPLTAWPEYEMVKVSLGFGIALISEMFFLVLLFVKLAKWEAPWHKENMATYQVVLAITLILFACRLFYNTKLLCRTRLKLQQNLGTPWEELIMNIAELVLFGESCVSSLAIVLLHKPCRDALFKLLRDITKSCRRGGGHQNSNSVPLEGTTS